MFIKVIWIHLFSSEARQITKSGGDFECGLCQFGRCCRGDATNHVALGNARPRSTRPKWWSGSPPTTLHLGLWSHGPWAGARNLDDGWWCAGLNLSSVIFISLWLKLSRSYVGDLDQVPVPTSSSESEEAAPPAPRVTAPPMTEEARQRRQTLTAAYPTAATVAEHEPRWRKKTKKKTIQFFVGTRRHRQESARTPGRPRWKGMLKHWRQGISTEPRCPIADLQCPLKARGKLCQLRIGA